LSVPLDIIKLTKRRRQPMSYTITLETFNGSTKKVSLPSRGAVAQFISQYPNTLPVGVSVKVACDTLSISGTLKGKAVL